MNTVFLFQLSPPLILLFLVPLHIQTHKHTNYGKVFCYLLLHKSRINKLVCSYEGLASDSLNICFFMFKKVMKVMHCVTGF